MNRLQALSFLLLLPFGAQSLLQFQGDFRLASIPSEATGLASIHLPATELAASGCTPKGNLVPIVLSYSVVGGGRRYSAPILSYVVNGTSSSAALTTNPTTYYMDSRTTWRTTNLLPASLPTERWATSQAVSGTATQCVTLVLQYTHQYLMDLEFSVKGGGITSGQEPTITYTAFGSPVSTRNVGNTWIDAGAQYSYTNPLSGSSQSQRWFTLEPSGEVTYPSSISPVYYYQLRMTVSYTQVGTGGTPPTFSSISSGSPLNLVLNATEAQAWLDATSQYSFTNPLSGSSSTERWATRSASGIILQPGTLSPQYFHQYLVSPSYTLKDGRSVKPPALFYNSFGALNSLILPAVTSQGLWMDAGSRYSAQNPLDGSTATERWTAPSSEGTVSSAQQLSFSYYHQFAHAFNYTVTGGGSPRPPTLTGVQFGKTMNATLSSRTSVFWLDNYTTWSVSNPLASSSSAERWIASMAVGGTVSRAGSASFSYLHQYYVSVEVSPKGSGSVSPQSDWQSVGAALTIVATPGPGWGFQGWQGNGNGSYTGPKTSVNIIPRGAVVERASFFSGILVNSTDGGTVAYEYGENTGTVREGTVSNILVPLGTNITLRAVATSLFIRFDSWSGDLNSTWERVSVRVVSPIVITANFVYDYVDMVLAVAAGVVSVGIGGTIITRRRRSGK